LFEPALELVDEPPPVLPLALELPRGTARPDDVPPLPRR
jgi:hypothetical protein